MRQKGPGVVYGVVNVTPEEFRAWKRQREYVETTKGSRTLGPWFLSKFGEQASHVARTGGFIRRRKEYKKIPCLECPRCECVDEKTLIEEVEQEQQEEDYGSTDSTETEAEGPDR